MQIDYSRAELSSLLRNVCQRVRPSRALPARGRGPRRIARSSVATASCVPSMSSRSSGCLSSASSVTGAKPSKRGFGGEPGKNAGRRVGERVAAGILRRDIPARQRGEHAAAERAVRRHQRGGLAVLHGFAQRHRDGERFFLGVGRFDHGERLKRRRPRALRTPARRLFAATCRSWPPAAAPPTASRSRPRGAPGLRRHRGAMPMRVEQGLHGELRMSRRRRDALALVAGDQLPRLLVEIGIEAGQHHGAVRQPRDGRDQFGGRRDRAGRARGDHRRRRSCAQGARLPP